MTLTHAHLQSQVYTHTNMLAYKCLHAHTYPQAQVRKHACMCILKAHVLLHSLDYSPF